MKYIVLAVLLALSFAACSTSAGKYVCDTFCGATPTVAAVP